MKFSSQEEYGLRFLLRIAKFYDSGKSLTIPEISQSEGVTVHNVAKILRLLRINGFLESERGQTGGYVLSMPPDKIIIGDVLKALGGKLFEEGEFCNQHGGFSSICANSIDCSLRSLWRILQESIDQVVDKLTLKDLIGKGDELENQFIVSESSKSLTSKK